jgi:hypothetical protein
MTQGTPDEWLDLAAVGRLAGRGRRKPTPPRLRLV